MWSKKLLGLCMVILLASMVFAAEGDEESGGAGIWSGLDRRRASMGPFFFWIALLLMAVELLLLRYLRASSGAAVS